MERRYSEFVSLHQTLSNQSRPLPPLPPKSYLSNTFGNDKLREKRRLGLEVYLQDLLESEGGYYRQIPALREFLALDQSLDSEINDSEWNSACEMIKERIHLCKVAFLEESDRVGDVSLTSLLLSLKSRLVGLKSRLDSGANRLNAMDFQVRSNTLSEMFQELGKLESLYNKKKNTRKQKSTPLFEAQISAKRVFGGNGVEDHSKLTNQQLLQLQKQKINDQDLQLQAFSDSLKKQKELGLLIDRELAEQNELLDDLEVGIENADTNMNLATKKAKNLK